MNSTTPFRSEPDCWDNERVFSEFLDGSRHHSVYAIFPSGAAKGERRSTNRNQGRYLRRLQISWTETTDSDDAVQAC